MNTKAITDCRITIGRMMISSARAYSPLRHHAVEPAADAPPAVADTGKLFVNAAHRRYRVIPFPERTQARDRGAHVVGNVELGHVVLTSR